MELNSGTDQEVDDVNNEKEEIEEENDEGPAKKKGKKQESAAEKNKSLKMFQVVEEIPIEFDFTPVDKHTSDEDPDDPPFVPTRTPIKRARKMTTPQRSRTTTLIVPVAPKIATTLVGGNADSSGDKADGKNNIVVDPLAPSVRQPFNRGTKYAPPPTINRYPCGFCDTVFTDISFLERHHKRCKAKRAAESAGIARGAGPSPRLTPAAPIPVPGNRQTYSCDQCTFTTKNPEHLKYHKPIHNDDKFFSCEECKFTCRELEQLNSHKKMHSGYKEFMYVEDAFDPNAEKPATPVETAENNAEKTDISVENQEFEDQGSNDEPGGKMFSCDQCSYTSSRPGYLVMHKRIHVREKPYECLDCGYKCTRLAYFKKHRATHAVGVEALACDRCSFVSTSQIVFDAHKQCHKA